MNSPSNASGRMNSSSASSTSNSISSGSSCRDLGILDIGQFQDALVIAARAGEVQQLHPLAFQSSIDVRTAAHAARRGLGGAQTDAGLKRLVALDLDLAVGQRRIFGGHAVELPNELDVQILGEPFVLVSQLFARRSETQAASRMAESRFRQAQTAPGRAGNRRPFRC